MDSPPAAVCLFPVSSEPAPACDGTNLALNSLYEPPRDPAGCCRIQTLGPEAEMKEEKTVRDSEASQGGQDLRDALAWIRDDLQSPACPDMTLSFKKLKMLNYFPRSFLR
ncbi:UNVERIFIED_CONTAM: hypothetical protein FKN15_045904 [Acipenser sinensis]